MIQQRFRSSKKSLSLSVRISLLLVLAAILPLLVAVTSSELLSRPQLISQASTEMTVLQHLEEIRTTAKYIENAANRQEESSKNLATAIRVTTQVTEQLGAGATSATDASLQLEQVVGQLRTVVGK